MVRSVNRLQIFHNAFPYVLRYLILLLLIRPVPAYAANWLEGWVVAIADGDTITILDKSKKQHKIRLGQIDAPESGMAYGRVAKHFLSDRVYRKIVRVRVHETDRYGRLVGIVYQDRKNINMVMVAQGYAWAYRHYVTDIAYCKAEDSARRLGRGLWKEKEPVAPWQWRRMKSARPAARQQNAGVYTVPSCGVAAPSR